ncbi:MAG: chromosomal replication initiator protein DnaA [Clostridia bacterium]|nr:chromosomal replication initiator protein DnaA [Clostridia bacterium]
MLPLNDIWKKACEYISEEISSPVAYRTWIGESYPYKVKNGSIYFCVPTEINKNMIEKRYSELIINSILEVTGEKYGIMVTIGEEEDDDKDEKREDKKEDLNIKAPSKYTFDNFVVGNSNKFAHAASLAVAETPGQGYNPLFIYGGSGLGKTHLMHAIENYIHENNTKLKTTFVTAETFTIELIEAVQKKSTEAFREKYRKTDVLFVDDIHFIAGKVSTEEEFHNTFNTLFDSDKQIVLTSDRPPEEIPNLAERLVTRFSWGVKCDIQPPEYETKVGILKQKAKDQNINISTETIIYISDNININVRELEGFLTTLSAYSKVKREEEVTRETVDYVISKYISVKEEVKTITPKTIISAVAKLFRVNEDDITSKRKTKEIVIPRQVSIYLCKNLTELSFNKIGDYFGGKDHSTVMHAVKKVESYIETDPEIKEKVLTLTKDLTN